MFIVHYFQHPSQWSHPAHGGQIQYATPPSACLLLVITPACAPPSLSSQYGPTPHPISHTPPRYPPPGVVPVGGAPSTPSLIRLLVSPARCGPCRRGSLHPISHASLGVPLVPVGGAPSTPSLTRLLVSPARCGPCRRGSLHPISHASLGVPLVPVGGAPSTPSLTRLLVSPARCGPCRRGSLHPISHPSPGVPRQVWSLSAGLPPPHLSPVSWCPPPGVVPVGGAPSTPSITRLLVSPARCGPCRRGSLHPIYYTSLGVPRQVWSLSAGLPPPHLSHVSWCPPPGVVPVGGLPPPHLSYVPRCPPPGVVPVGGAPSTPSLTRLLMSPARCGPCRRGSLHPISHTSLGVPRQVWSLSAGLPPPHLSPVS